ncbi:MAG: CapA family protein, partial [Oscillospiraceae bacterium]
LQVFIGADIFPTRSNASLFARGDLDSLLGSELSQLLRQADLNIFNLEVPLTDCAAPIPKCGPCLIAGTEISSAYQKMPAHFLTLANNHILDQGAQGLAVHDADAGCRGYRVRWRRLYKRRSPQAAYPAGWRPENRDLLLRGARFPSPRRTAPAQIPLTRSIASMTLPACVRTATMIVLYHGGKERYHYPSPNLQKICRKFVRAGANSSCQHRRCVGCKKDYRTHDRLRTGNFLFDDSDSEFWQTGLLLFCE